MSLITCPECSVKISDQAGTCPHCGYPVTAGSVAAAHADDAAMVRTIEKTGKKYKAVTAFSVMAILVGLLLCVYSAMTSIGSEVSLPGPIITFVGLVVYLINRIYIWWHHE